MLDLWLQPVTETSASWATSQSSVLDPNEVSRWRRYRTDESRNLFLVAHVATRHVLSNYADRDPAAWRFGYGTNGRPEVMDGPTELRFNTSHTKGMVAVLVHGRADCGVDIEHPWRETDIVSISRRVFTDTERASIIEVPEDERSSRFYELWTLKEAFIKAKGKGFALPLSKFGFSQGARGEIRFDCALELDPDPSLWRFTTDHLETGHIVSVAAHDGPTGEELRRMGPIRTD